MKMSWPTELFFSTMEDRKQVNVKDNEINFGWIDSSNLRILIGIFIVILSLFIFFIFRKSSTKKNGILLLGICEAGKTLIFARLVHNAFVQTHTSVKENLGDYLSGNKVFKIIDIPGHERLRYQYFEQFKTLARSLVFVLDSTTIQNNIKDVAEFLYHCLIDPYISSNMPPLLILCNKQSEALAKGSQVIKTLLEKEMNILRTTQGSQLESLNKSSVNTFLGKKDKEFEFSQLYPMKVDFAECDALISENTNDYNLSSLEDWIKTLI